MTHCDEVSVASCSSALTAKTSNVTDNAKNEKKKKKTALRRRIALASEKERYVLQSEDIIQSMAAISKLFVDLQTTDLHDSESLERRLHCFANRVNRLPIELRESFSEQLSVYLKDRERLLEGERCITELPKMRERIEVLVEQVRDARETEDALRLELEVTQTQLHEARVQANKQAAKRVPSSTRLGEDEAQIIPPGKRLRQTRVAMENDNGSPSPSTNSNSTNVSELEKARESSNQDVFGMPVPASDNPRSETPNSSSGGTWEEGAGNEIRNGQFAGEKFFVPATKASATSANEGTSDGEASWSHDNRTQCSSSDTGSSAFYVEDNCSDDCEW